MSQHSSKAVGHKVLVQPDPIEEVSKGGIVIATDTALERGAQVTGIVVDIGPEAFRSFNRAAGFTDYRPWVKVGDHIWYAKYAGKRVKDKLSGEELLFLIDEDIAGLVE